MEFQFESVPEMFPEPDFKMNSVDPWFLEIL